MEKDSPDQKAQKCRQKVQEILNKYNCIVVATPIFSVKPDGSLNVVSEVTIVPLIKPMIKPKRSKYMN